MRKVRFKDGDGELRTGQWSGSDIISDGDMYDPTQMDVLPPVDPTKLVCVGMNYREQVRDYGREYPERPVLFLKSPNAVVGHGSVVRSPTREILFGGELGVIVKEQCFDINEGDVTDVIAGYTCIDDLTNDADFDTEEGWLRGKSFDGAAPMGPVCATPDEVPDDARIRTTVNDEIQQDSRISNMIFSVTELVAEISSYMTLEAGDVIATGSPAGVEKLTDGDTVQVDIEGIGTLQHTLEFPL